MLIHLNAQNFSIPQINSIKKPLRLVQSFVIAFAVGWLEPVPVLVVVVVATKSACLRWVLADARHQLSLRNSFPVRLKCSRRRWRSPECRHSDSTRPARYEWPARSTSARETAHRYVRTRFRSIFPLNPPLCNVQGLPNWALSPFMLFLHS